MATQVDFWGDIGGAELRTPVTIMREQAALLGAKTQNVIEARVKTDSLGDGWFVHRFTLIVPSMDNYAYELFSVQHPVDLYPVTVPGANVPGPTRVQLNLGTEETFTDWLRAKLSSAETKRIIGNLLAMAKS